MKELLTDLWIEPADARCVTTNGIVTEKGTLVMGGGTARQAADRYDWLPLHFGKTVEVKGNKVQWVSFFRDPSTAEQFETIISFPTKDHYRDPSTLTLIERSSKELMELLDGALQGVDKVLLPRPGVGLGGLKWDEVKPVIEPILDDRVVVIWNGARY